MAARMRGGALPAARARVGSEARVPRRLASVEAYARRRAALLASDRGWRWRPVAACARGRAALEAGDGGRHGSPAREGSSNGRGIEGKNEPVSL
jgi:hypothetical protein